MEIAIDKIVKQIQKGFEYLKNNKKNYDKGVEGAHMGTPNEWCTHKINKSCASLTRYHVIVTESGFVDFSMTASEFEGKMDSLHLSKENYYCHNPEDDFWRGFTINTFVEKPVIERVYRKGFFSFTEDIYALFALSLTVGGDFLLISPSTVNYNKKRKMESRTAYSNCNGAIGVDRKGRIVLLGDAAEIIASVPAIGGKTFDVKEYLKSVGFSWNADEDIWVRPVPEVTVETVVETVETVVETVVIETPIIETIETPVIETVVIETPIIETIETPTIETPRTYTRKLKDGRVIVCKAPVRKAKTVVETVEPPKTDKKAEKKAAFTLKLETWLSNNKAKLAKLTARGVKTRAKLVAKIARLEARLEAAKD